MARRKPDPGSGAGQVVQATLNETYAGLKDLDTRIGRFNRAYDIWRSPEPDRYRQARTWEPRLRVKYAMQTLDQATVNIVQGVPKARCTPRTEDAEGKAEAMEKLLGYYADLGHLAEKQTAVVQQALIYGVSPAKNRWLYKEADAMRLEPAYDQAGNVVWEPTLKQNIVECDRPDFQPWDAYDTFWTPGARDPESASYVTLRSWPTKDELLANQWTEDTPSGLYRNLDLLFQAGSGQQRPQTAQNEVMGLATSGIDYKDRFEIWEVWRNDRLTIIGNRQVLLYHGPKLYWMAGKPVVIGSTRPDFFAIEGISETELIDHLQQQLQAQDNLRLENQRMTVQRGATVRLGSMPDTDTLALQPRFLFPVQDHDDLRFVSADPLPPEAYQEHETLKGELQDVTGITPYVTGAGGADQTTATGVSTFANAAGKLLVYKADQIAKRVYQRTFEQWADLTKQFVRSEVAVRIEGPGDTVTWAHLGPADVYGDFDVRVESSEESLNRSQRRADAIALLNAMAPYAQAGLVDPKPLARAVAEAYDFPNPDSLFPQPQQQPQAAPNGNNGSAYPVQPGPFQLGGGIAPTPNMSILRGNA